jgi:O-antigen ligase
LWSLVKGSHRVLALACVFLGITALVSTGSRIGMSAAAVTLLAFILVGLRFGLIKRETLVLLFVLILAFGFIFSSEIYTRFTADDNGSASARPMMWNLAIKIIEANPWLGVGAGNYALATRDYYSPDIGRADEVIDIQVHDAYLGVAGEGGIFALLFYLGMLGAAFFNAWSCAVSRSRFISLMGIGISLGIISLCIQMVTGTFHMRSITLFLWLVIALAASLRTIKDLEPSAI